MDVKKHEFTSVSLSDSILRKDIVLSLEQLLFNERLQAHIIVTEWSVPDSACNQYPVKTTVVNVDKNKKDQSVKSEQFVSETIQVKKDDIARIEREKKKVSVNIDTRLMPKWGWWFLIVGGLIFALLYWLIRIWK